MNTTEATSLLRKVTFETTAEEPLPFERQILIVVVDSLGRSINANITINIILINDQPHSLYVESRENYTEEEAPVIISPFVDIVDEDSGEHFYNELIVEVTSGGIPAHTSIHLPTIHSPTHPSTHHPSTHPTTLLFTYLPLQSLRMISYHCPLMHQ